MAALARELFVAHGAAPWVEQATEVCARAAAAPVPAAAARRLAAVPRAGGPGPAPDRPLLAALTEMERRVADHVADGATNREIAGRLYVSVKTVEATLTRVYRKLGVRSRTQLSRVLLASGRRAPPGSVAAPLV